MTKKASDPFAAMAGPGAEAFKLWISFWPVAPFFGVEWRFADAMGGMGKMGPMGPMGGMPGMGEMANFGFPGMPGMGDMSAFGFPGMGGTAPAGEPSRPASKPAPARPASSATVTVKPAAKPAPKEADPKPAPKAAEAKPAAPKAAEPKPAEPRAAEPKPEPKAAEPAPAPAEAPAATDVSAKPASLMSDAPSSPDDLKLIKGIGPGLESKLNALGVYTFEQIAGFSETDLVWIDENLTAFKGRCFRDDWVGQAKGLLD